MRVAALALDAVTAAATAIVSVDVGHGIRCISSHEIVVGSLDEGLNHIGSTQRRKCKKSSGRGEMHFQCGKEFQIELCLLWFADSFENDVAVQYVQYVAKTLEKEKMEKKWLGR